MIVREPIVAGRFYPDDPQQCRRHVQQLFAEAAAALDDPSGPGKALPEKIVGGIVPHAGWVFSGEPAARTLEAIARGRISPQISQMTQIGKEEEEEEEEKKQKELREEEIKSAESAGKPFTEPLGQSPTFVVFGAMHRSRGSHGLLFDRGVWRTPLGDIEIDERLAQRLLDNSNLLVADPRAHDDEHSIEVQLPLIQARFPQAKIVPILVPPVALAEQVGLAVGRTLEIFDVDAVVLGSTDLTHYGPSYGFTPQGIGPDALRWSKEVNDAGLIDAVVRLDSAAAVEQSNSRLNACGGGAVAATLSAARKLGATRGVVLEHITSFEVMVQRFGEKSADAVGYLSAVLG
jgi:AmmeMemoRadiSam system protein B